MSNNKNQSLLKRENKSRKPADRRWVNPRHQCRQAPMPSTGKKGGKAKKVADAGVKKEKGFLYFLDKNGDVAKAAMDKDYKKEADEDEDEEDEDEEDEDEEDEDEDEEPPWWIQASKIVLKIVSMIAKRYLEGENSDWKLMGAAQNNFPGEVKRLIDQGADVNATDEDGNTALMYASAEGHTVIVSMLIEAGADVNAKDIDGLTALMLASGEGHTETVSTLIKAGADVNAKTKEGWTALMAAADEGHPEIVKLLKKHGAR